MHAFALFLALGIRSAVIGHPTNDDSHHREIDAAHTDKTHEPMNHPWVPPMHQPATLHHAAGLVQQRDAGSHATTAEASPHATNPRPPCDPFEPGCVDHDTIGAVENKAEQDVETRPPYDHTPCGFADHLCWNYPDHCACRLMQKCKMYGPGHVSAKAVNTCACHSGLKQFCKKKRQEVELDVYDIFSQAPATLSKGEVFSATEHLQVDYPQTTVSVSMPAEVSVVQASSGGAKLELADPITTYTLSKGISGNAVMLNSTTVHITVENHKSATASKTTITQPPHIVATMPGGLDARTYTEGHVVTQAVNGGHDLAISFTETSPRKIAYRSDIDVFYGDGPEQGIPITATLSAISTETSVLDVRFDVSVKSSHTVHVHDTIEIDPAKVTTHLFHPRQDAQELEQSVRDIVDSDMENLQYQALSSELDHASQRDESGSYDAKYGIYYHDDEHYSNGLVDSHNLGESAHAARREVAPNVDLENAKGPDRQSIVDLVYSDEESWAHNLKEGTSARMDGLKYLDNDARERIEDLFDEDDNHGSKHIPGVGLDDMRHGMLSAKSPGGVASSLLTIRSTSTSVETTTVYPTRSLSSSLSSGKTGIISLSQSGSFYYLPNTTTHTPNPTQTIKVIQMGTSTATYYQQTDADGREIWVTRTGAYAVSTTTLRIPEATPTVTKYITRTVTASARPGCCGRYGCSGCGYCAGKTIARVGTTNITITESLQTIDNRTVLVAKPTPETTLMPLIWDAKYLRGWEHVLRLSLSDCHDMYPHVDWDRLPGMATQLRQHNLILDPELSIKYALILWLRKPFSGYPTCNASTTTSFKALTTEFVALVNGSQFVMPAVTETFKGQVLAHDSLLKYDLYDYCSGVSGPGFECDKVGNYNATECEVEKCMLSYMRPINITTAVPALMFGPYGEVVRDYFIHETELRRPHWGTRNSSGIYYPATTTRQTDAAGSTTCRLVRQTPDEAEPWMSKHRRLVDDEWVHPDPSCSDVGSCHTWCSGVVREEVDPDRGSHDSLVSKLRDAIHHPLRHWKWLLLFIGLPLLGLMLLLLLALCCCVPFLRHRRGEKQPTIFEKIRRVVTSPAEEVVVVNQATGATTSAATGQAIDPAVAGNPALVVAGPAAGAAAAAASADEHRSGSGENATVSGNVVDGRGTTARRAEEGRGRVQFAEGTPETHTETVPAQHDGGESSIATAMEMPEFGSMRGRKRSRPESGLGFNLGW